MENYALIPFAEKMLADDPKLAQEFNKKVNQDKDFAKNAEARLNWLYEHSPFYDQAYLKYPVLMSYQENIVIPAQKDKEI